MDFSKIVNEMESFFKLVNTKRNVALEIIDRLSSEVNSIISQLKVFTTANQCVIPARILKDFPDVKSRVIVNLVGIINEGIRIIDNITAKLYNIIKELRKSQEKIARLMFEVNWSEHKSYYSAFNKILEWTEKCWKTLYFLHTNVSNGIKFLACDQSHSAMHLKRVSEIKSFDRSILFAVSDMSHLLTMLKSDLLSRSQNISTFS